MQAGGAAGDRRSSSVKPPGAAPDFEPSYVAGLFDRNASWYDRVNTVMTFGLDARWRRWAARQAAPPSAAQPGAAPRGAGPRPAPTASSPRVLDACAGTGLLALELARRGARVTAADAAPRMLAVAHARLDAAGLSVRTVVADLSDPASSGELGVPFDAITVAFGLRYFADPGALLASLRALLAPGGRVVVVESVCPPRDLRGRLAGLYFFYAAPRIGAALAGNAELYEYLAATTRVLGTADDVAGHLRRAGFRIVARRRFAGGVVAGFVAAPG